jgi:hypothetical protein
LPLNRNQTPRQKHRDPAVLFRQSHRSA